MYSKAADIIRRASEAGQPFLLSIAPFAPHTPATMAPITLTYLPTLSFPVHILQRGRCKQ